MLSVAQVPAQIRPHDAGKKSPVVWVSAGRRCLSFHFLPGFEEKSFPDDQEMWKYVEFHLSSGYLVQ